MGGLIVPGTTIHGAIANPGIPFADSPTGGFYETPTGGLGLSIAGQGYLDVESNLFTLGYKPAAAFALSQVTGSPFSAGTQPKTVLTHPNGLFVFLFDSSLNAIVPYNINPVTGNITPVSGGSFAATFNTNAFGCISPNGQFLYYVTSTGVGACTINQQTGILTAVAGSPFATGGIQDIAISPNGSWLAASNITTNNINVFAINQTTGALTNVAGSPFASPASDLYGITFSANSKFLYPLSFTNGVYGYTINQSTGALTAVTGSPFAVTGNNSRLVITSPDSAFVLVGSNANGSISVFAVNASTGALSAVSGSPFSSGLTTAVMGMAMSPDGTHLYCVQYATPCFAAKLFNTSTGALTNVSGSPFSVNGGSSLSIAVMPDGNHVLIPTYDLAQLGIFQTATAPTYNLLNATFDPLNGLNGVFNINGTLTVNGTIISSGTAGSLLTPFYAKSLTLDNVAGGLKGTAAANNALAGMVGEYIQSSVAVGSAVALTTAVAANVTSISLTPGDWDVEGIIAFHSATGTTNVNDISNGASSVSATLPTTPGSVFTDLITIVVPSSPDVAYMCPRQRFSLSVTTTIYLVTLVHFTVAAYAAYGQINARRVR